jgi:hypothetical protein
VATRHNLCQNPACSVSIAGWGGDATPSRATGLTGFPVSTGASYTASGTFVRTQLGAVTAGQQYTISAYVRANNLPVSSGHIYAEWTGAGTSYTSSAYSVSQSVVTRISHTGTAPPGATAVAVIIDGVGNFNVNSLDVTAVLIEQTGSLDTYFDGDSPGATWDGTTGLSASTLVDSIVAAINPATETDTAQPLGRVKFRTAGVAVQTEAAQPFGRVKRRALGVSAQTDTAMALGGAPIVLVVPGTLAASSSSTSAAARSGTSSLNATTGP